ncbi:putative glycoside hydrolase [Roseateles albus]|uniref:Glycoside hydrolase n=1 Tax=Roseateles albus TaxID=2987525 RepID=A0ABT5KNL8_9BURK|nr:putative glycoside hydrolase [Roseateles albus]MDC8774436.1 putative glycoside hydrolase [Roseateles albus]
MKAWALIRFRLCAWLALALLAAPAAAQHGLVRDRLSGQPIAKAVVMAGSALRLSDASGRFDFDAALAGEGNAPEGAQISARAIGYRRTVLPTQDSDSSRPLLIELTPIRPKALYLSVYGVGSSLLRGEALKLIERTQLNALVIDIKGDRGLVPYRSAALVEAGLPPQKVVTVSDMPALMKELRARGLYLIARIVSFKDDALVVRHPEWAVRDGKGAIWKDHEDLAWIDPMRHEAWAHSLNLAEEAAQLGFDEVQFDYVRFPDALGLSFRSPNTEAARVAAIGGFLAAARQRLRPYNVFISADIFGYVAWNSDDTQIGQQLESLGSQVDYLSPMLYPSGFKFGIPGHRNPVAEPGEIVELSLRHAMQRSGLIGLRFRPWLQAFRDYGFDHREFGEFEIRQQIEAAEACDTDGWMLWNPLNRYDDDGLNLREPRP